jgi:hypothetical protein
VHAAIAITLALIIVQFAQLVRVYQYLPVMVKKKKLVKVAVLIK